MIKTICDFCGKETDYIQLDLPIQAKNKTCSCFYRGHPISVDVKPHDICQSCLMKLVEFINKLKQQEGEH